ncbi:hypothetical protein [Streptomyces sp. NPDC001661]
MPYEYELLGDRLPWYVNWYGNDEGRMCAELAAWLHGRAAARLRAFGASREVVHRIELLALTGDDRWAHPHWPGHRY